MRVELEFKSLDFVDIIINEGFVMWFSESVFLIDDEHKVTFISFVLDDLSEFLKGGKVDFGL